jgi:hypothetical protein
LTTARDLASDGRPRVARISFAVAGLPGRGGRDLINFPVDGDHDGIGCE